jgi:hypothetical protein
VLLRQRACIEWHLDSNRSFTARDKQQQATCSGFNFLPRNKNVRCELQFSGRIFWQ